MVNGASSARTPTACRTVPAALGMDVLRRLSSAGVVLLRGRDSLLRGEPQNDIDIYSEYGVEKLISLLEPDYTCETARRSGAEQWRVVLTNAQYRVSIPIDVFHQVTWRGIRIARCEDLEAAYCSRLMCRYLDAATEGKLTLLKNVLHGSNTPPEKLAHLGTQTVSSVAPRLEPPWGQLGQYLMARVAQRAFQGGLSGLDIVAVRALFVSCNLVAYPLETVSGFSKWIWLRALMR